MKRAYLYLLGKDGKMFLAIKTQPCSSEVAEKRIANWKEAFNGQKLETKYE